MALGRQRERQSDMLVSWAELPRSPGHAFYEKLQTVLIASDFDRFVEMQCASEYAPRHGRPSLPPGRYFRMLLVGYFEGIDSERGLEWRCADSLSLREFLRLGERERVPDHSWLSRTRSRLPLEVHDKVFTWVLGRSAEQGLIKGERIGVDASTMEANAALRTIVRRDNGEGYREMLTRMAKESGIETSTAEDLLRLDRNRKGKKLSNADWQSPTDPDAKIAKLERCGLYVAATTTISAYSTADAGKQHPIFISSVGPSWRSTSCFLRRRVRSAPPRSCVCPIGASRTCSFACAGPRPMASRCVRAAAARCATRAADRRIVRDGAAKRAAVIPRLPRALCSLGTSCRSGPICLPSLPSATRSRARACSLSP